VTGLCEYSGELCGICSSHLPTQSTILKFEKFRKEVQNSDMHNKATFTSRKRCCALLDGGKGAVPILVSWH